MADADDEVQPAGTSASVALRNVGLRNRNPSGLGTLVDNSLGDYGGGRKGSVVLGAVGGGRGWAQIEQLTGRGGRRAA